MLTGEGCEQEARKETTGEGPKTTRFETYERFVRRIRELVRQQGREAAHREVERLLIVTRPGIRRVLGNWRNHPDHFQEMQRECEVQIIAEWFSLTSAHRFWERNFQHTLNITCQDTMHRYLRKVNWNREVQEEGVLSLPRPHLDDAHDTFLETVPNARRDDPCQIACDRDLVRQALALLEPKEREVVLRFRLEEYSQQEISQDMQMTDRTVRNHLRRADTKVACLYGTEGEETASC